MIRAIASFRDITVEVLDGIEEKLQFRLPPALNRLTPAEAAA